MVVGVVGKVDRAAGHFRSGIQHRLMDVVAIHALAAKGGDQRGVDIQDTMLKVVRDRHVFEEPGHQNVVNFRLATGRENILTVFLVARHSDRMSAALDKRVSGYRHRLHVGFHPRRRRWTRQAECRLVIRWLVIA